MLTTATVGMVVVRGPGTPPASQASPIAYVAAPERTRTHVLAYMIGDSVVAGASIGKPEKLLGAQMAQRMNWDFKRDGFGGSGYVAKGNQPDQGAAVDQAFQTRLPAIIKAAPDVVIVAGGRNDMYFPVEEVRAAAEKFLSGIRMGLPNAKIVTIAGWRWNTTPDQRWVEAQAQISSGLEEATEKVGGVFIDPAVDLAPIDDTRAATMIAEDLFHPTEAGHAYLGRDLAYELVERGIPRGPEVWKPKGLLTGEYEDATDAYFATAR
jgi:lysophospholipase L1-like esterase